MNQLTGNMTSNNCERKTRIVSWKFLDEAANHEWYTHEFLVNKISRQNKTQTKQKSNIQTNIYEYIIC